jgi:hypothetical protein
MAEFTRECESGNRSFGMNLGGICRAIRADALHLDGRGGGFEAARRRGLVDRHPDAAVAHLEHAAAGCADEKLSRVEPMMGMVDSATVEHVRAADERGQSLDLVDETLGRQKLERAIDSGRRRRAAILAQPVEEIVGAGWPGVVENEAEDQAPLFRQAQVPSIAEGFSLIE